MKQARSLLAWSVVFALFGGSAAMAQRADVAIESDRFVAARPSVLEKLKTLREGGQLLSISQVEAALKSPTPAHVDLPVPATTKLSPAEVAARARQSSLRIGYYYLCNKCDNWHVTLGGGYVVGSGGVAASAHHVLVPRGAEMREGYLIAEDLAGNVYPVSSVLAADATMDAAVFKLAGADNLKPFALNDQVGPGDAAFLLSDPKSYSSYFSSGIVNRFFWKGGKTGDAQQLSGVANLRINVSTDWAPGSSGSAVLDDCGNMIAHVSTIRYELSTPPAQQPRPADNADAVLGQTPPARPIPPAGTQILLHDGVPARAVKLLIEQMSKTEQVPTTQKATTN
ncbi:MAG: trypsin-like peptidase domain-containing protein [Tepidisphaeraceae bacterium]